MDATDCYKSLGCTRDKDNNKLPYLSALTRLIECVSSGGILQRLHQSFSSTYFLALYKDPKDLSWLRPIGIGTALRRLVAAHLCAVHKNRIADHLLPYNWAIGIKEGTEFVINVTQAQVDHYINLQDTADYDASCNAFLDPQRLPTRALVSLDIKNMFDFVSRARCRAIL